MISIIAAVSKNGIIGKGDEIPWYLPDDFKYFAKTTKGHTVIMGRKTYETIIKRLGHPLPNRKNIVLSSRKYFTAPGCEVVDSVSAALKLISSDEEAFIIGGSGVYKDFLPVADKLYITEVNTVCDGDRTFPDFSKEEWKQISSQYHPKDDKHKLDFTFLQLERI